MSSKDNNLSKYKIEAIESADNLKVGIVVSEWNEDITATLLQGAIDTLKKHNVKDKNIHTVTVPGSYELPMGAKLLLTKYSLDTVICLGCVIKGQTPHFDLICSSTFNAILNLSINFNKPIGNGIITALNMNQAIIRSKKTISDKPNKGHEAANAVLLILKNGTKKI
jgi:6,7-dimethyl-8-ribityllumazine synthase